MNGAYVLLIHLNAGRDIVIGRMGPVHFRKGFYAYVGSALNGLDSRIMRHLRAEKTMHWHIDYFLKEGKIVEIHCFLSDKKEECAIARGYQKRFPSVPGFGCSDCFCPSHLFYSPIRSNLRP